MDITGKIYLICSIIAVVAVVAFISIFFYRKMKKKRAEEAELKRRKEMTDRQEASGKRLIGLAKKMVDEMNGIMERSEWKETLKNDCSFAVTALPRNGSSYTVLIHRPDRTSCAIGAPGIPGFPEGQIDINLSKEDPNCSVHCFVGPYGPERYFGNQGLDEGCMAAVAMVKSHIMGTYRLAKAS